MRLQDEYRNMLLRQMATPDLENLVPHLQPFRAARGASLFPAGEPAEHAIFLECGMISIVAESDGGQRAEAGVFGREGFGPIALAIGGDRSPHEGTVQLPDDGYRIAVAPFRAALDASASLRLLLQKFVQAMYVQTAFTALSNAVHPVEQRLARWILMCDDRSETGELALTHEFMSVMLAVRRPSVTTALHVLEGNGLIKAERGLVAVRNRTALQAFAGDAYGKPEAEYERLLGPFR